MGTLVLDNSFKKSLQNRFHIKSILVSDVLDRIEFMSEFLSKYFPAVKVLATASNIPSILEIIDKSKVDLFIVEMNEIDTKDDNSTLENLNNCEIPSIVLVENKFDLAFSNQFPNIRFIKKPITEEAIDSAIIEFKLQLADPAFVPRMNNTSKIERQEKLNVDSRNAPSKIIAISHAFSIQLIKTEDIIFLKANGKYTSFHLVNNKVAISSKNLGEYDNLLQSNDFIRIHHSFIINLDQLMKIDKDSGWFCEMSDGTQLPISRRRKDVICECLNLK